MRLATTMRNVGPDIKYDQAGSPLPQQLVLGTGFSALGGNLTIGLDAISSKGQNAYFVSGLEYRLIDFLRLRVGYNGVTKFVGSGMTYGIGIKINQWNLDYAYVPFGDLGNTQRVSVGVRFGRALQLQVADDQVEKSGQSGSPHGFLVESAAVWE